jgi:hypothetical protein
MSVLLFFHETRLRNIYAKGYVFRPIRSSQNSYPGLGSYYNSAPGHFMCLDSAAGQNEIDSFRRSLSGCVWPCSEDYTHLIDGVKTCATYCMFETQSAALELHGPEWLGELHGEECMVLEMSKV